MAQVKDRDAGCFTKHKRKLQVLYIAKMCIHKSQAVNWALQYNKFVHVDDKNKSAEHKRSQSPNHSRSIFRQFSCQEQGDSGRYLDYNFYRFADSVSWIKFMEPRLQLLLGEPLQI